MRRECWTTPLYRTVSILFPAAASGFGGTGPLFSSHRASSRCHLVWPLEAAYVRLSLGCGPSSTKVPQRRVLLGCNFMVKCAPQPAPGLGAMCGLGAAAGDPEGLVLGVVMVK